MPKRPAEDMEAAMRIAAYAHLSGASRDDIAAQAGVDPSTITRWKKSPEWKALLESCIPGVNDLILRLARGAVIHALQELKDPQTARFVLERLDRDVYGSGDKRKATEPIRVVFGPPPSDG